MAKVKARRLIQGIIDQTKIQRELEKVPEELLTKIVPVFVSNEKGNIKINYDSALNDSSKTYLVPEGVRWEIDHINVLFTSTATVGNRRISVELLDTDGSTILWRIDGDFAQAASNAFYYTFSPNISTSDNATGSQSFSHCPKDVLAGYTLRIRDRLGVAPTADDMIVTIVYKEFTYQDG